MVVLGAEENMIKRGIPEKCCVTVITKRRQLSLCFSSERTCTNFTEAIRNRYELSGHLGMRIKKRNELTIEQQKLYSPMK